MVRNGCDLYKNAVEATRLEPEAQLGGKDGQLRDQNRGVGHVEGGGSAPTEPFSHKSIVFELAGFRPVGTALMVPAVVRHNGLAAAPVFPVPGNGL